MRELDNKWLRSVSQGPILGSSDIQSLADLANSYSVLQTMRTALITKEDVLRLTVATLVPVVPLLLTMMPVEELLKKLVEILIK